MKTLFLAALMISSSAFTASVFARDVHHEMTITKGPYFVPVTNSVFNPLGPDFKSTGNAVVYMSDLKISVEFPRVSLFTLAATPDDGDYFFSTSDTGPKVRVGFQREKLSWFFGRSRDWMVTIADKAQKKGVAPTSFAQMNDEQLIEFAVRAFEGTDAGGLDNLKVQRDLGKITVTAEVAQMGENDDEPTVVGTAVFGFLDVSGARKIVVDAKVTDLVD